MSASKSALIVTFSLPASVSQAPSFELTRYAVFELTNGERHFFGFHAGTLRGRVSSPIVAFAHASMTGTTKSRRTYHLQGLPGGPEVLEFAQLWCEAHGAALCRDVTREYLGGAA